VIRVTFDQAIESQSVTPLTFRVDGPSGTIGGVLSVSGNAISFAPSSPLKDGQQYQVGLESGIAGVSGVHITSFSWVFNTIDLPPQLTETWPAAGGEILPNGVITVSFNELIDPTSVTNTSFRIDGPSGPVAGSVSAAGKQASFKPLSPLQESATYTTTLTSDITDSGGSHYGSGSFWFTAATPAPATNAYVVDWGDRITAWQLNSSPPPLTSLGELNTGTDPSRILVTHSKKFLYVLNGASDNISAYAVSSTDGSLSEITDSPFPTGNFPYRLAVTKDDAYLYVVNLESHDLSAYSIDPVSGGLTSLPGSPYSVGLSPNSVIMDPRGDYLYVANADVGLQPYQIEPSTGQLTPGVNKDFYTGVAPLDLVFHPNGRFVFGANNMYLYVFYIDPETHEVSRIANTWYTVGQPFDPVYFLALDPTGRVLYAYNNSDFGMCFYVNPDSGLLTRSSSTFGQGKWLSDMAFARDGMTAYVTSGIYTYQNYPLDPIGAVVQYTVDAENCTLQVNSYVNANYQASQIVLH